MPIIIAVSGPPGAEKTTLVQNLMQRIPGSTAIYSDDYQSYTQKSPEDKISWLTKSGDPNDFDLSDLVAQLRHQKYGPPNGNASTSAKVNSPEVICFETQFGRRHVDTGQFIDYQIWIELPADISLARNIQMVARQMLASPANGLDQSFLRQLYRFRTRVIGYSAALAFR